MSTQKNEHNPSLYKPSHFAEGDEVIHTIHGWTGKVVSGSTEDRIRVDFGEHNCDFGSGKVPGLYWPINLRRITHPTDTTGMVDGVWTDGKPLGDSFENPQPNYKDLWDAFVKGAQEARMNPTATDRDFNRAADAYCKLLHSQKAPEFFESLTRSGTLSEPKADTTGSGREGETHCLKTWPEYFKAVKSGAKTFEIRLNDRGFKVGDVLVLQEFDPQTQNYTGEMLSRKVTYSTDWEQKPGHIVMGLAAIDSAQRQEGR